MLRKIFQWIFKAELLTLQLEIRKTKDAVINLESQEKRIKNLLDNLDVSVDYHHYGRSWAVISLQGQKSDYIKFVDLSEFEIREIQRFIERFDRSKVDADTIHGRFLKETNPISSQPRSGPIFHIPKRY